MGYWPLLLLDGNPIDLTHLEPFEFRCRPRDSAEDVTISVRFNDHCFTTTFDVKRHSALDILPEIFVGKHEKRVFCETRYRLSLLLPELIRGFGTKRVASTRSGNLVRVETPEGETYAIFFTLRRMTSRHAQLFVVSAYPVSQGRHAADTGDMKFDKALAKVLRGEKPRFPGY